MRPYLALVALLLLQQVSGITQQSATAKAAIEGNILRVSTGEAIGDAQVTLVRVSSRPLVITDPLEDTIAQLDSGIAPTVRSDATGKFVFKDLDPGTYRLSVAANGFARQEYGQRSFGTAGSRIELLPGTDIKGVTIHMTPAATVAGRVIDDLGLPVVGTLVQLVRLRYDAEGRQTFQTVGSATTNDHGEYRIYWVTPGTYYLAVTSSMSSALHLAQALVCGGSLNAVRETYGLTFYPGVTEIGQATAIDLPAGAELNGVSLKVPRGRFYRIRGRVIDAQTGRGPSNAAVSAMVRDLTGGLSTALASTYDAMDGSFEIRNVPAGKYVVTARPQQGRPDAGANATPGAAAVVSVVNSDVENVVLTMLPPAVIQGRLRIEGKDASEPINDTIAVYLVAVESLLQPALRVDNAMVEATGLFRLNNVKPGEYRVRVFPIPFDFYVKDARFDREDVLNRPLAFSGSVPTAIDITVSPNGGRIEGTAINDKGEPLADVPVVLVPEEARDRYDLYKTVTSDQAGHFRIRGITPGRYRIFAWAALEPYAYLNKDFTRRAEPNGKIVTVAASDKLDIDVRVISPP